MGGENVEIKEDKVACFTAWYKTIVLYLPWLLPHNFYYLPLSSCFDTVPFVFAFFLFHFLLYCTSRTVAARIALVCQGTVYVYARKYQAYGNYQYGYYCLHINNEDVSKSCIIDFDTPSLFGHDVTFLFEITLVETHEACTVTCFVLCHFVNSVVNSIHTGSLCVSCNAELVLACAALCSDTCLEIALGVFEYVAEKLLSLIHI